MTEDKKEIQEEEVKAKKKGWLFGDPVVELE